MTRYENPVSLDYFFLFDSAGPKELPLIKVKEINLYILYKSTGHNLRGMLAGLLGPIEGE